MDLPIRKKLPHVPPRPSEGSWFFVTINSAPRNVNQLCRAGTGDAVIAAIAHNHEKLAWFCRMALLMPDHVHAIIAFPMDPGMSTTIARWKHFLATKQRVTWQRDFFDHRLRTEHEIEETAAYIAMNPVRKGLCERAEDWPWIFRPKPTW